MLKEIYTLEVTSDGDGTYNPPMIMGTRSYEYYPLSAEIEEAIKNLDGNGGRVTKIYKLL